VLKGLIRVALAACLVAVFVLPATTASAATRCPATFQVLHNDRIGAMSLPAGAYYVTVSNLSCAQASTLFANFLRDYDGDLPYPWRGNASARSFTNGTSSFSVKLARQSPAQPSGATTCVGTFSVLNNDRIGTVALPQGQYVIKIQRGMTCSAASTQFAQFLDSPSGVPAPWTIRGSSGNASFADNMGGFAFTATKTGGNTGGGGRSSTSCGTFTVVHNDHIGSLYVPKGGYEIVLPAGSTMTCALATRQFNAFLDAAALPSPWVLDAQTASFARGFGSTTTFGIDPIKGSLR
jgi:hypothetical protein